jgi:hypothetical protein
MKELPPADPILVADTVAALPLRLRARLDDAVAAASTWALAGGVVRLPSGVEVLLLSEDGALRRAEHVVCSCLLAPVCLHRASVLAAAPFAVPVTADQENLEGEADVVHSANPPGWGQRERTVAELVRQAAARVLETGVPGAGAEVQSELLRAIHVARLEGLHRLASAATRVVTGVRAGREDDSAYSLEALTRDMLEVLEVAQAVGAGLGDRAVWRGRARSVYSSVGGLRLTGLCMEPVVSKAAYAGVVVWLVDADGRPWSVSDVKPGGAEKVGAASESVVAIGESQLTHRQLSRGGIFLSGATANPEGRLGAGIKVGAVTADGTPWTAALTVCGSAHDAVLAIDSAGTGIRLQPPPAAHGATFRDNLRLLGSARGLRLLCVGRPSSRQVGAIEVLAVGGEDLSLPESFGGHADLGIDRLSSAFLQPSGPAPPFPARADTKDPLGALRRRIQRVVSGGRGTLTVPGTTRVLRVDVAALRRAQLTTGVDLLEALVAAGQHGRRDAFGRLVMDDPDVLSRAWLAVGVYEREVSATLLRDQWRDLYG